MAAGFNNCQITEAIQNLPPELRETIYKHFLTIKLKEREALGWNIVHNELFKKPFYPKIYCVKEKRYTRIMQGSEKVVITKNNRKLLKVKCASCGITKTRFLPGRQVLEAIQNLRLDYVIWFSNI